MSASFTWKSQEKPAAIQLGPVLLSIYYYYDICYLQRKLLFNQFLGQNKTCKGTYIETNEINSKHVKLEFICQKSALLAIN